MYQSAGETLKRLMRAGEEQRETELVDKVMKLKHIPKHEATIYVRGLKEDQKIEIEKSYSEYLKAEEKKKRVEEELRKAEEERIKAEEARKLEEYKRLIAEEQKRQRYESVVRSIPIRFKEADISDFKGSIAEKQIEKVLASNANWLCLGMNGVGKTRLAYALLKEWGMKDETAVYVTATEFSSRIRAWIMQGLDVCFELRNRYGEIQHFIIDEIDKCKGNENDMNYLSYFVDLRYKNKNQTVIFGNKGDSTAEELIGTSIYSRMVGEEAVESVYWRGKDKRIEK